MAANEGLVKKICFHKNDDTSTVDAIFVYNYKPTVLNREIKNSFVQILNFGNYELMKSCKKTVASADSLFGTLKRYYFAAEVKYFMNNDRMIRTIKKLDKTNILSFIPASSSYNEWISQNKINFKKEENVINFLNYYNSKNN